LVISSIIWQHFSPKEYRYLHFGHRTTIPLILSRQPLRLRFIIMRSIWYRYSSKSSINKILSRQSIADGEPNKLYNIDRLPPTNSPLAFLLYSWERCVISYSLVSKREDANLYRLCRSRNVIGITPWIVLNPIVLRWLCKTVISLKPTIHLGCCLNLKIK
jgi:hypothetical protein